MSKQSRRTCAVFGLYGSGSITHGTRCIIVYQQNLFLIKYMINVLFFKGKQLNGLNSNYFFCFILECGCNEAFRIDRRRYLATEAFVV